MPWSIRASIRASAPIRVRLIRVRGPSWSISRRACSTAAAPAVPSAGTWLRLAGAPVPAAVVAGGSPFVIVMSRAVPPPGCPATSGHTKTLATRRGSRWFSVFGASAASVPPCPSVLPPGAGNKEELKKPIKAGKERAKQIDGKYALGLQVAEGHGPAPAVGRHDDGDAAAVATLEEIQATGLLF